MAFPIQDLPAEGTDQEIIELTIRTLADAGLKQAIGIAFLDSDDVELMPSNIQKTVIDLRERVQGLLGGWCTLQARSLAAQPRRENSESFGIPLEGART